MLWKMCPKVHKLRNQVFSFLQKQESLHLLPVVKAVYALQGEVEKLHQQQEAIYLLLFKIKTIQDISLSTLYQLSGEDEETLTGIINQNKQRFLAELEQFRQKLKTPEVNRLPAVATSTFTSNGMITKISRPSGSGKIVYDNKGSAQRLVNYLAHEAKPQGKEVIYFNQTRSNITAQEVAERIDGNRKGLRREDAKFYSLIISPSAEELGHARQ